MKQNLQQEFVYPPPWCEVVKLPHDFWLCGTVATLNRSIRKRCLFDLVNSTYISDFEPRRLCDFIFSSFFSTFYLFFTIVTHEKRLESLIKTLYTKYEIFNLKEKKKMSVIGIDQLSFSFRS